jgi:polysaccharide pyruvyl transferase WcaK-like protein
MRVHHFYPRTHNIGDHFVQRGISAMIRRIVPEATFELFDVNSRGQNKTEYGLTRSAIERANRDADLVVVGGSNLYEGSVGWPWGVHLDPDALKNLRVPLFLLGLGTGSSFASPLHQPTQRAVAEIKALNDHALLSCVRDLTTVDWLHRLGIAKAKLMGDPATFIFNQPAQPASRTGHVLITVPPRRVWSSKRQFWKVRTQGRPIFAALAAVTRRLVDEGQQCIVVCNDPIDLPVARELFDSWSPHAVVCPNIPEEYFELLANSRAVVSGRLHTAVVAFSLGIRFLLIDIDGRTNGFLRTYQPGPWSIAATDAAVAAILDEAVNNLLRNDSPQAWLSAVEKRDQMYAVAMNFLEPALKSIG